MAIADGGPARGGPAGAKGGAARAHRHRTARAHKPRAARCLLEPGRVAEAASPAPAAADCAAALLPWAAWRAAAKALAAGWRRDLPAAHGAAARAAAGAADGRLLAATRGGGSIGLIGQSKLVALWQGLRGGPV